MIERIMEIILYVISNVSDAKLLTDDNMLELEKRGYTKSEISTAFSWLYEKVDLNIIQNFDFFFEQTNGFRIFHNIEKDMFTSQAYTELLQFMSLELISPFQVDILLERMTFAGLQVVDSRFLKNYLAALHIESMQFANKPGRAVLLGNDTIN